jgi:hypothetical protein
MYLLTLRISTGIRDQAGVITFLRMNVLVKTAWVRIV